jgi:nitric oxide reductase large subunit
MLSISFWTFDIGYVIEIAACFLFIGITLFLVNILLTVKDSKEENIEIDFIQASMFWFWLTAFIGALLAFNFKFIFLPKEHLYYLKIHAHIGLVGWFLCLIIGVASKLIPMFLLSGKLNTKVLTYSYYIINLGLLGFIIDALFYNGMNRVVVYFVIVFLGILFFLSYIAKAI